MIFHTSVPLLSTAVPSCIIYSPVYGIYIKILHCLLWYFVSPVQRHTIIVSHQHFGKQKCIVHQHFGKQKCIVHQHFGIVIRLSLLTLTGLINRPMEKVIFVMFQLRPHHGSYVVMALLMVSAFRLSDWGEQIQLCFPLHWTGLLFRAHWWASCSCTRLCFLQVPLLASGENNQKELRT